MHTDEFGAWVEPHWAVLNRVARRLADPADAEDVLQDALVGAWRNRDRYDPERGAPRAWLIAFVVDHAGRAQRRRRPVLVDDVPVAPPVSGEDLRRVIRALPTRQRLAVELFYYVDLSVADTAAVLGCAEGTVKSTLSDARKALRAALGEDYRYA